MFFFFFLITNFKICTKEEKYVTLYVIDNIYEIIYGFIIKFILLIPY